MKSTQLIAASGLAFSLFLAGAASANAQSAAPTQPAPSVFECVGLMFSNPAVHKELCGVNDISSGVGVSNYSGGNGNSGGGALTCGAGEALVGNSCLPTVRQHTAISAND